MTGKRFCLENCFLSLCPVNFELYIYRPALRGSSFGYVELVGEFIPGDLLERKRNRNREACKCPAVKWLVKAIAFSSVFSPNIRS